MCVYIYIYTTYMYKYTYIYIQINKNILYYSIQKYMHIHTHLYNLVKIPYTYRDRHHLERGGGECYGRLALIWRILYIQDLPGAAFAWRQRVWGYCLIKVSCVFCNQVHHRICNFERLTSAALFSIWNIPTLLAGGTSPKCNLHLG